MLAVTPRACHVSNGRRDSNTHLRSGAPVPLLLGRARTRYTIGTEPAHTRYGGNPLSSSRRFQTSPSRSWRAVGCAESNRRRCVAAAAALRGDNRAPSARDEVDAAAVVVCSRKLLCH